MIRLRKIILMVFVACFLSIFLSGHVLAQTVFLESEGRVVVEAETFSSHTPSDTHEWFLVSSGGLFLNPRGSGYIQVLPDNGGDSPPLQPPFVDYVVRFDTVGVYRLYVRWAANVDQSDTFYASVVELNDGPGGTIADWYRYVRISNAPDFAVAPTWFGSGGFERTDSPLTNGETSVVWTILEPGDYTIRFDMREDGAAIDAFVFQLSSLPAPTGDGPPSSPTVEELTITTTSIPAVKLGDSFSQEFEVVSGVPPYSWFITDGTLPSGVDLSPDGILSGTPPEAGEFTFTVRVEDSNGDFAEKEFTLKVLVTLPPPDIRINKVGTAAVPGRVLDYFIVVENVGDVSAINVEVLELLDPSIFTLVAVDPPAVADVSDLSTISIVLWVIPSLSPGEVKILSYKATLDSSVPIGAQIIGGPVCSGFQVVSAWHECVKNSLSLLADCGLALECAYFCSGFCTTAVGCVPCVASCAALYSLCWFDAHPFVQNCWNAMNLNCAAATDTTIAPIDPNEKVVVANKYIQPDQTLVYPIHFENIGQVEALDVFIRDVLGPNLDESTLEILTPGGDSYDAVTRLLKWDLIGRNLQPGETGNVMLSIKPMPGLPSGTEIKNSAEIQFEIFDTLVTPEVVNIIDTTPPVSTMNVLPAKSLSPVALSWTATDAIGEIDTTSVFVSTDGGPFTPILTKTKDTSTSFTGVVGKTYGFICIATDTAGNTEVQDPTAETVTLVTKPDPPGDGGSGNGCFIDTAAFGSTMAPE